jgi:hypothetical protein
VCSLGGRLDVHHAYGYRNLARAWSSTQSAVNRCKVIGVLDAIFIMRA